MSIYDDLQKVASGVFAEFKQGNLKYRKVTVSGGTPYEPGSATNTDTLFNGTVSGVSAKFVDSGLALATDLQVNCGVLTGIVPTLNDFILVDNVPMKICQIIKKPAAGVTVAYSFIVRA